MLIDILNDNYMKSENIYEEFLDDTIKDKMLYKSPVNVEISKMVPFPIYAGVGYEDKKQELMVEALMTIEQYYLNLDRELLLNQNFWHTLFLIHFRDYILDRYPEVQHYESKFKNIVIKKFDWENYIYKAVLGAQYVHDNILQVNREKYYTLIIDNLDLFNYIIKYRIFRNDSFLIKVLNLIDEYPKLSQILKSEIVGRKDLGKDERYGRRVVFEFNKSYPVSMSPMMDYKEFKRLFFQHLAKYYDDIETIR